MSQHEKLRGWFQYGFNFKKKWQDDARCSLTKSTVMSTLIVRSVALFMLMASSHVVMRGGQAEEPKAGQDGQHSSAISAAPITFPASQTAFVPVSLMVGGKIKQKEAVK